MTSKIIKTEEEYDRALERINELMGSVPGTPEGDELELLATLVELYEEKAHPIGLPDPVEAIKFRMEQLGLRQKDLVPFVGSRSKVSEVLSGRRPLSLAMVRKLHDGLGIPAEVLLRHPGAKITPEAECVCDEKVAPSPQLQKLSKETEASRISLDQYISSVDKLTERIERLEKVLYFKMQEIENRIIAESSFSNLKISRGNLDHHEEFYAGRTVDIRFWAAPVSTPMPSVGIICKAKVEWK